MIMAWSQTDRETWAKRLKNAYCIVRLEIIVLILNRVRIAHIFVGIGGVSYFFQGSKVYEVRGRSIQKTHSLRLFFPNGPLYVEAAYINERSQALVLFQSYQVQWIEKIY